MAYRIFETRAEHLLCYVYMHTSYLPCIILIDLQGAVSTSIIARVAVVSILFYYHVCVLCTYATQYCSNWAFHTVFRPGCYLIRFASLTQVDFKWRFMIDYRIMPPSYLIPCFKNMHKLLIGIQIQSPTHTNTQCAKTLQNSSKC